MTLNDTLRKMRESSRSKLPPETLQSMADALNTVEASGQHKRVLKAGTQAPGFVLEDQTGKPWSANQLLKKGPLVINFYRGSW